jgi:hypothetical protein
VQDVRKIIRGLAGLKERNILMNWPAVADAVKNKGFPPGFMLTPNTRCWWEDEVMAWVESRPSALDAKPKLKGGARRAVERKRQREAAANSAEA